MNPVIRFAGDQLFGKLQGRKPDLMNSITRSAHPGLAVVDIVSQRLGGPSISEGFKQGVTRDAIGRGGTEDDVTITLPPMPF